MQGLTYRVDCRSIVLERWDVPPTSETQTP